MARAGLEQWRDLPTRVDDPALAEWIAGAADDPAARALLDAVFGNSPYLTRCLLHSPSLFQGFLEDGPDATFDALRARCRQAAAEAESIDAVMATVRRFKRGAAPLVALADIAGLWPLERLTGALSTVAEDALSAAAAFLLRKGAESGAFALADAENPERGSGLIILGMGKLGARELNYSSDIDLIVLYDAERIETERPDRLQQAMVRLTRDLVRAMEERTADGYVFRTDLRLRPDPSATPLAISMAAAEVYYESQGQNWERAAMIKARPVAGDIEAGKEFLGILRPFVWRKNLDFAAIQDIHSIKRQINAHRGGGSITVAGHNVKLGRGGIREIEFFAQTQQLIWGGKDPALRSAPTCEALRALAEARHVEPEVVERLIEAYGFLRTLEHRLQMVDDQQTHSLPKDDEGLAEIATFMGFEDRTGFEKALLSHLRAVEEHYADLFEESPELSGPGNLVFTGGEHDPDTLETLQAMGFQDPEAISTAVRRWHHGRYAATRSTRAREILTEFMPALLASLAGTANPDAAFLRFDEFLRGLPAGVQLFSLFHQNPQLFDLVAEIMGGAPELADRLSRRPGLLDAVLDPDFTTPVSGRDALSEELEEALGQARDYQDVLDIVRRWANDRRFQVGVHILRDTTDPEEAGAALSDIADAAIMALQPRVEAEFADTHGTIPGGALAIVALGKLGGREMTVTSDLDLLMVYDHPADAESSDGAKPLPPSLYYARLTQRMVNALTALTPEGQLYEVDLRLRPSGNAGPVAPSLDAFVKYQTESAWTWEHMALTRARCVAGPEDLRAKVDDAVRHILTRPRDPEKLLVDVADMRARMAKEHVAKSPWQIKHLRGGLVDVEFIAQYLMLRDAVSEPEVLSRATADALARLRDAGALDPGDAETLIAAVHLWRKVQGALRLTSGERFDEDAATAGHKSLLVRACGGDTFDGLKAEIVERAEAVLAIFERLIDAPAAEARNDENKTKESTE